MLTVPDFAFTPYLPPVALWIAGQLEIGEGGFRHWQLVVLFKRKCSLSQVRECFGPYHAELTRSKRANDYVFKDSTSVPTTRFELGVRPTKLNSATDWEKVWESAQSGNLLDIPPFVRVKSYRTLRAIASDFQRPQAMVRTARCLWGPTATGKSHRAWEEAGCGAYIKSARTKYWDGYSGQNHVIIDEFRGDIAIGYMLTWLDKYPVSLEVKGSTVPHCASKFWICSNLHPTDWYPDVDHLTYDALIRRMEIIEMADPYVP